MMDDFPDLAPMNLLATTEANTEFTNGIRILMDSAFEVVLAHLHEFPDIYPPYNTDVPAGLAAIATRVSLKVAQVQMDFPGNGRALARYGVAILTSAQEQRSLTDLFWKESQQ